MTIAETAYDLKDLQQREKNFEPLYEEIFPVVADIVSKQGGTFQGAKDIFQEALIIFYEKNVNGDLNVKLSEEAFIVGIAKHLWIKKFKSKYRLLPLDFLEKEITILQDYFKVEMRKSNRLLLLLEEAEKKCIELLRSIYYDKLSMNEISQAHGFSNPHSVSAKGRMEKSVTRRF